MNEPSQLEGLTVASRRWFLAKAGVGLLGLAGLLFAGKAKARHRGRRRCLGDRSPSGRFSRQFTADASYPEWGPYTSLGPQWRGYYEIKYDDPEVEGEFTYWLSTGTWGVVPFQSPYKTYVDTNGPYILVRFRATKPPSGKVLVTFTYTP